MFTVENQTDGDLLACSGQWFLPTILDVNRFSISNTRRLGSMEVCVVSQLSSSRQSDIRVIAVSSSRSLFPNREL